MRDKAKDEAEKAVRRRRAMEAGFRLFAERGIDPVTMPEIAEASGVGRPSLYRYFSSKADLVIAIGAWKWQEYLDEVMERVPRERREALTAREHLELFLDTFLDLYRNHRDILRFNHFFNSYIERERVTPEQMKPYRQVTEILVGGFHTICGKAGDGTLRRDLSEALLASSVIHIMLAAVTRYAVGLVYVMPDTNPEDELVLLRSALLREFASEENRNEKGKR